MAQARLVNGVVLRWKGKLYTNSNLTDEVAREFLSSYPQRKDWFAELPSATTDKKVVAEVANEPSAEVSEETEPTTPKKEKSARKRK